MGRVHQISGRGLAPLPLALLAQSIARLSRRELEALTERLIDRLDQIDGDADLEAEPDDEDNGDREQVQDCPPMRCNYGSDQRVIILHGDRWHVDGSS